MTAITNRSLYLIRANPKQQKQPTLRLFEDEVVSTGFNYSPMATKKDTTVSTATAVVDDGSSNVTVSSVSNTAIEVLFTLTAATLGSAVIKVTTTFADSDIDVSFLKVIVDEKPRQQREKDYLGNRC